MFTALQNIFALSDVSFLISLNLVNPSNILGSLLGTSHSSFLLRAYASIYHNRLRMADVPPIISTMSVSETETFTYSLAIVHYDSQCTALFYTLIRDGHEAGDRFVWTVFICS